MCDCCQCMKSKLYRILCSAADFSPFSTFLFQTLTPVQLLSTTPVVLLIQYIYITLYDIWISISEKKMKFYYMSSFCIFRFNHLSYKGIINRICTIDKKYFFSLKRNLAMRTAYILLHFFFNNKRAKFH